MSAGQVEITSGLAEGDIVVARAGALLREGDPVRPVTASARAEVGRFSMPNAIVPSRHPEVRAYAVASCARAALAWTVAGSARCRFSPRSAEVMGCTALSARVNRDSLPLPGSARGPGMTRRMRWSLRGRPSFDGTRARARPYPPNADVFQQATTTPLGHLLAFGGAGDGDAGLVEGGFGAGLRIQIVRAARSPARCTGGLAVVGDLARRRRGQDQRVFRRGDRGEAVRVGAEAALIGVAAGGVDARRAWPWRPSPSSRPAPASIADAVAADVGFLPDRGIDRDHVALAADLDADSRRRTASPRCPA